MVGFFSQQFLDGRLTTHLKSTASHPLCLQLSTLSHLPSFIKDLRRCLHVLIGDKGTDVEVPADALPSAQSLQQILRLCPRTYPYLLEWFTTASPSHWFVTPCRLGSSRVGLQEREGTSPPRGATARPFCSESFKGPGVQLGKASARMEATLGFKAWERLWGKCLVSRELWVDPAVGGAPRRSVLRTLGWSIV